MGLNGKGTRPEAIWNSILTLVLLNEHRSRRSGEASSQVQNTGVPSACKRKVHADQSFFQPRLDIYSQAVPRNPATALPARATAPLLVLRARLLLCFCRRDSSIPKGAFE